MLAQNIRDGLNEYISNHYLKTEIDNNYEQLKIDISELEAKLRKVTKEGKMKAVVSVTFDNEFVVHDIKVIEGDKGLFIAMPSREKFTAEAAQYAVDNVESDWKENALKKAEFYQEHMAMSPSAIYDQLVSEYGEQFTAEEAQYAVDNLN